MGLIGWGAAPAVAQTAASPYISLEEIQATDRYWVVGSFYRDSVQAFQWWRRLRQDKWPARILRVQEEGYEPIFYIIYDNARPKLRALVYQIYVKDFYNRLARIVPSNRLVVQTQSEYQRLKRPLQAATKPETAASNSLSTPPADTTPSSQDRGTQSPETSPSAPRRPLERSSDDGGDSMPASTSPAASSSPTDEPAWMREERAIRERHQREAQLPPVPKEIQPSRPVAPYYVIVGSFQNPDNARRLAGVLIAAGLPAKLFLHPNGTYYRVAVYPSLTETQARKNLQKAREEIIEEAWLLTVE